MPSIASALRVVGLGVLAVGVLVGGLGAVQAATDNCESGYGLTLHRLEAGETADPSFERVAYGDLTDRQQAVFVEILESESTPVYDDEPAVEALDGTVIPYRGERYEAVQFVSDCADAWVGLLFAGGAGVVAGTVVAGGSHAWLWVRE